MVTILAIFMTLALAVLVALATMILKIGTMLGECPGKEPIAKSAAIAIATGFCSLGAGGVMIIGAAVTLGVEQPEMALTGALGLTAICLGLGFTQAVSTLRVVVNGGDKKPETSPEAA